MASWIAGHCLRRKQNAYVVRGYEAPVGEIETAVAEIWAEVLGVEQVGRHDNFFELGGHSLLAVRVIERMRQAGMQVDVRALFVTPTLTELAAAVSPQANIVEVPPNRIKFRVRKDYARDVAAGATEGGRY